MRREMADKPSPAEQGPEASCEATPAEQAPETSCETSPAVEQDQETALEAAADLDDSEAESIFSTAVSSTASLTNSIFEYRQLHGRTFQSSSTAEYWGPNDDQQLEGLDLIYHVITILMGDKLFVAPIGDDVQRVLDIGTGTGIWACDFADDHPGAEVIGTDISPVQATWVPPNVRFIIDDCLLDWTWPDDHFDFIHIRCMYGSIPDFVALYKKALKHLKPGGYIQCIEVDVYPRSDHVYYPDNHIFHRWAKLFRESGERLGKSFCVAEGHTMRDNLDSAGFVGIVEKKFKMPMHGWPKDQNLKRAGFLCMAAIDQSLEGFALYVSTEVMGWTREEALVFTAEMRREVRKLSNCAWLWA